MRRPRGGAALTRPDALPQSWVPRVVNAALAVFLLLCIAPVVSTFGDHSTLVQVWLVLLALPVLLVAVLCLASALRPGSLGRAARRARARRRRD